MRIQVDFCINKDIEFWSPLNEAMTSFIYRCIKMSNPEYADMLHDTGYRKLGYKKFIYHAYCFSQNKENVNFYLKEGTATLIMTSALDETIINFVKGMMKIGQIQLFGYSFNIENITYIKEPKLGTSEMFRTLSPVYATRIDGKWLKSKDMEKKLGENLLEKYYALYQKIPEDSDVKIKILSHKPEYIRYKKDTYRGYKGLVVIEGAKELIRLAYNAGLGARCGQGMGLLGKV